MRRPPTGPKPDWVANPGNDKGAYGNGHTANYM
jgi:hypothetical protein